MGHLVWTSIALLSFCKGGWKMANEAVDVWWMVSVLVADVHIVNEVVGRIGTLG